MKSCLLALLVLSAAAGAERHALLIGVGAYKTVRALEGPPNDVDSLSKLLKRYGYKPQFVHELVDERATKKNILDAMKSLEDEVKPGDYFFFYYSGHGTSFFDPANRQKQLIADDTGASLPIDFDNSSLETFKKSILLGNELRPYFTAIDAKAQVFAVYDSCFSQDSMKALPKGTPKYVPLSQVLKGGELDDAEDAAVKSPAPDANAPLPYKHLIAISAAKRDQAAIDISAAEVKRNPQATYDGHAHGQLTNALMMGLEGAADKNHDRVVSHEELFNYVNEVSAGKWPHNPKLRLSADSGGPLAQPALASKDVKIDTACHPSAPRMPRISAPAEILARMGKGFEPVENGWDVKAVLRDDRYLLYDTGGVQMNDEPMSADDALARLRSEPVIQRLSELHYCKQAFNIELSSEPGDLGKYIAGQRIKFSAKLDREAYLLVIDIDQQGGVTVDYASTGKAVALKKGVRSPLVETRVESPYGVDLIKAFAFENKPPGFDNLVAPDGKAAYWHPGDPAIDALLKMLATDAGDRSETRLQLTTSSN